MQTRALVAEFVGTAMLLAAVVASTSFANPAVTVARALTDTFAGIRPADVPPFVAAQVVGAAAATMLFRWLVPALPATASDVIVPHVTTTAREEVEWTR